MSRVTYYETHPLSPRDLVPHKKHYEFEDAYWFVWRHIRLGYDELAIATHDFAESLRGMSHLDDSTKFEMLHKFATNELDGSCYGTEQRRLLIEVVGVIEYMMARNEYKGDGRDHFPKYGTWENHRHGRKRSAYRWKVDYSDKWHDPVAVSESKCWKDQRGKGRNKRTTQYRPVEF